MKILIALLAVALLAGAALLVAIRTNGPAVLNALDRVTGGSRDVALVAHGHYLRVLAATWLGLPPEDGRMFDLGTGTYCVLGFEHEYRTVIRWNAPGPESSE